MDKYFPFYKMDVNGFIFHLNEAIAHCAKQENVQEVRKMDYIRLMDVQYGFKLYKSWGALQDQQSELVQFLTSYC